MSKTTFTITVTVDNMNAEEAREILEALEEEEESLEVLFCSNNRHLVTVAPAQFTTEE